MTNDNDLLLLASSQNNGTYKVYINSAGKKTLTPQTANYTATYGNHYVCNHPSSSGLLYGKNPKKVICPNCSGAAGGFYKAFMGCTSLTSISFPSLRTAIGGTLTNSYLSFYEAFYGCTSLTFASFPSLTSLESMFTGSEGSPFYLAFSHCSSSLKVHFKKSMKGTAGLNYSTMGLTSAAQVVFDLP